MCGGSACAHTYVHVCAGVPSCSLQCPSALTCAVWLHLDVVSIFHESKILFCQRPMWLVCVSVWMWVWVWVCMLQATFGKNVVAFGTCPAGCSL